MPDTKTQENETIADQVDTDAAVVRIPVLPLALSLGLFFSTTYILCVGFDLLFPGQAMYETWLKLLPGFTWLSWPSFFLGLTESFAYGVYGALVFGPMFNILSAKLTPKPNRQ